VIPIILDTDTGVDDAVAIALAARSPEIELVAVTSVAGNAPVRECTRNCLLILELLGADTPVAAGAAAPLAKELLTAPEVHGADGLGGKRGSLPRPRRAPSDEPAHEFLVRLARERPGQLTLVTTGPLTNVARALALDRDAVASYSRVITMGGAFRVPGNTGPVAEFNVYVDPEAAAAVFASGLELTLVPLDATTRAVLLRSELESRPLCRPPAPPSPGRDLAAVLYRALDYYIAYQRSESGLDGGFMHDALAVAAAMDPALLDTTPAGVEVAADGPERGRTTANAAARGHGVRIAFGHDCDRFREMLSRRVLEPVFGPEVA